MKKIVQKLLTCKSLLTRAHFKQNFFEPKMNLFELKMYGRTLQTLIKRQIYKNVLKNIEHQPRVGVSE